MKLTFCRLAGSLVLAGLLAGPAAPSPGAAEIRAIQKLSIISGGGGHQVLFYNYTRQTMIVSHYSEVNSGVPFLLTPGQAVGAFLYDFWSGRFTEAIYAVKETGS